MKNWNKINNLLTASIVNSNLLNIPLTFLSLVDNNSIILFKHGLPNDIVCYYSYNNITWNVYTIDTSLSLNAGEKISFKCTTTTFSKTILDYYYFSSTGYINVYGNIMSLVQGECILKYIDTILNNYQFCNLFYKCSYIIDASNLLLPATTLANSCYYGIFRECTNLIKIPLLPATILSPYCYYDMFKNCISLLTTPLLPATILASGCYYHMFDSCQSLVNVSLLPAKNIANGCYSYMFYNCQSLTTAPLLPAITLANDCYANMFNWCISLTGAPYLPASSLVLSCYVEMFRDCSKLSSVNVNFTDWKYDLLSATQNWVYGVASTGIFYKQKQLSTIYGNSYIPSGWRIENKTNITPIILKCDYKDKINYQISAIDNYLYTYDKDKLDIILSANYTTTNGYISGYFIPVLSTFNQYVTNYIALSSETANMLVVEYNKSQIKNLPSAFASATYILMSGIIPSAITALDNTEEIEKLDINILTSIDFSSLLYIDWSWFNDFFEQFDIKTEIINMDVSPYYWKYNTLITEPLTGNYYLSGTYSNNIYIYKGNLTKFRCNNTLPKNLICIESGLISGIITDYTYNYHSSGIIYIWGSATEWLPGFEGGFKSIETVRTNPYFILSDPYLKVSSISGLTSSYIINDKASAYFYTPGYQYEISSHLNTLNTVWYLSHYATKYNTPSLTAVNLSYLTFNPNCNCDASFTPGSKTYTTEVLDNKKFAYTWVLTLNDKIYYKTTLELKEPDDLKMELALNDPNGLYAEMDDEIAECYLLIGIHGIRQLKDPQKPFKTSEIIIEKI